MTAKELLARLSELAVELRVEGERLRFHAPPGGLPPELRNELVARKPEGLALLRGRQHGFPHLLSPFRLGALALRNRIVVSPMEVDFAAAGGTGTGRTRAHSAARAAGGAGLVVVEATCVDAPEGLISHHELRADDDAFVPGL